MVSNTGRIIVGIIGLMIVFGGFVALYMWQTGWTWDSEMVDYDFDSSPASIPDSVILDINMPAGAIEITFTDDPALLYDIHMEVNQLTINQYGDPTVTFSANEIDLTYEAASATIVLGSGTNYTIDIDCSAASVSVIAGANAHIGDVSISASAGSIDFQMTSAVSIYDNITIDFEAEAGSIDADVTLPSGFGGSFDGATSVGTVTVTPSGSWSEVSGNNYETSDYATAESTVTITAETTVGSITADLA
ncbi:MAG: hypothetical protein ACW98J_09090 [Candidatus Thorarchaeota archaeon]|jgi:hypothetical protein